QQASVQQRNKELGDSLLKLEQQLQVAATERSKLQQQYGKLEQQQARLQQEREQQIQQYQQLLAQVDSMQELVDLQYANTQGLQSISQEMLPQLRQLQGKQQEFSQELAAFRAQTTRSLNELRLAP